MKTRLQARITGRVQGVGFRPTVYRHATALGLTGFVRNDPTGVVLEVEGDAGRVNAFLAELRHAPPPQAVIADIATRSLAPRGDDRFVVVESDAAGPAGAHISPDLPTCADCQRELADPRDRRHGYPFLNCANCGPRFTILRDLPYDRANTSMAGFAMCPACAREYHNPANRRFHAQPDACPQCGPALNMPVDEAVRLLQAGQIVAIKSLGGFHLACRLEAIPQLRERKQRPHKPLAVMFRDLAAVKLRCEVSEREEAELLSNARPIVLLKSKLSAASPDSPTLGAFLPYTPLHHLLLAHFDALVMTSANVTDEPIASDDDELPAWVDTVLTHNRPIVHKCDDSVVRVVNGQRQLFRRARGFAPNPLRFAATSPQLLAVGGELKNTFCLARAGWAFLSQHIGDLRELRTVEYFEREIAEWQRLMRVEPVAVAHDLHPDYQSTRWALAQDLPTMGVQHHHAHIASVMAEHDLQEPVIGVALDGTGYGTDGTVWGGEFLVATRAAFARVAHFKQYRLPGGEKAIHEPWRMAVSLAHHEDVVNILTTRFNNDTAWRVRELTRAGFNSPLTSSAGRLFDGVAALLGLCDVATYEAQAAIRLESSADPRVTGRYGFAVRMESAAWILDFGDAIRGAATEGDAPTAAAKFHNTVAAGVIEVCQRLREQRGLTTVALSGGVWQNEWLLRRVMDELQARRFRVFTNVAVPPNDGGLALGQIAVAAERTKLRCA